MGEKLRWIETLAGWGTVPIASAATGLILFIALADHLSGGALSVSLLYAVPIAASAWFIPARIALALSFLSVALWLTGDGILAQRWDSPLVLAWNGLIRLLAYSGLVALLSGLRKSQARLESRVLDRTEELRRQSAERERLQRELVAVCERERRGFGNDLHDSICQHLTATAFAAQVVAQTLSARDLPEAQNVRDVVRLIQSAISQSRSLARGLNPIEVNAEGLPSALEEFAASTSELFHVSCSTQCGSQVPISGPGAATHLYRIAQEAVRNSVRHGKANTVRITLDCQTDSAVLRVVDDGVGVPADLPPNSGMGLRVMAHRASLIGGTFAVGRNPSGGTVVECALPILAVSQGAAHA